MIKENKPSAIGTVHPREIVQEMKTAYLDYAMSVIVARALPDVRDGLKPVHRRILYAMYEMGLTHGAKLRKSAGVVGEVLGKFHPHGDISVYDALVRMAQDFSERYPLIDGQGNFGSIDDDPAAAMRYCVTGDTLVVTEKGLIPIEQISCNHKENINIRILSQERTVNRATKWFDSGRQPVIAITTHRGFSLRGSYNHPILTWSKNLFTGLPEFHWKLLEELCVGDIAVIDRTPDLLWPTENLSLISYWPDNTGSRAAKKILPQVLDENIAFILGSLVAEGTLKENELEFCNSDRAWMDEFAQRWGRIFPDCRLHAFHRNPSSYGKKPYHTFEIHSRHVIRFLRNLGLLPVKSPLRTVPKAIFRSPKQVVASFLRAYFEGDGTITFSSKMTELSAISTSEKLVSEIQVLLLRFGISATKRFDKYRGTHKLYIRGLKNCRLFQEEIGFVSDRKKQKLRQAVSRLSKEQTMTDFVPFVGEYIRAHLNTGFQYALREFAIKHNFDRYGTMEANHHRILSLVEPQLKQDISIVFEQLLENQYIFEPIVNIENAGVEPVYSIRVESTCHSFVGNGFVNHNTECRMSRAGEELLKEIEKNTVDFVDTYDGMRQEPKVLPSPLPQLLLNGTLGIAVGMATNIPPHNLPEVADAAAFLIDNPKADSEDLFEFIKGPDFPTGGTIFNKKEIIAAYSQGKGPIVIRGKAEVVEGKTNQIVISEIPFQVTKSTLVEQFANLVQEKKIEGIRDIRDESDKDGLRIVFDLAREAQPQKILNRLYKFSDLQKTFHLNLLALVDGIQPKVLSLAEILLLFLEHRRKVVTRRTQWELDRAKERAHILEGLVKCLGSIDEVIKIIRRSDDRDDAKKNLMARFRLSEIQANAILDTKLSQLAKLERKKIEEELAQIKIQIKELILILENPRKINEIIRKELEAAKAAYGDQRRTKVVAQGIGEIAEEDLIPQEDTVITLTQGGYIKRINPATYKIQKRGGKGIVGMKTMGEDIVEHFLYGQTHDSLMVFTDSGKVFQIPLYEIAEGTRVSKGRGLLNFVDIAPQDKVLNIFSLGKQDIQAGVKHLVMVTKDGIAKKTPLEEFKSARRSGLIAITLKKGDLLKAVRKTTGEDDIIIATKNGQSIRFKENQVRAMGRQASGIKAIRLKKGDEVIGMDVVESQKSKVKSEKSENDYLLVLSENGYGKKTDVKEYRIQSRGGSGIKTANVTQKIGKLSYVKVLAGDEEDLIVISRKGQVIRTPIASIPKISRSTQGVRIMRLDEGDKVVSAACL